MTLIIDAAKDDDDVDAGEILCAEVDPELWYSSRFEDQLAAKKLCFSCHARARCLEFALELEADGSGGRWGIWGGALPDERQRLYRRRHA